MIPTIALKDRKAHGLSEPKCPDCDGLIMETTNGDGYPQIQCSCNVWHWVLRTTEQTSQGER